MIDVKAEDGIATVTIRYGKANALDIALCEGLAKCFEDLRASDARAVVVTGQGRIFSAGVDLLQVTAGGADYVRKFLPTLHRLYDAVFFHPRPVVAAINGHAIAGGCVLACCADRRIMARGGGRMGVTELLVGVPFPALAFEIMRFAVPRLHLPEFTFGGATYDVEAALAHGWVDEVAEADALPQRAVAAAQSLARLSPLAFAQTKKQLRQEVAERVERSGAMTDATVADILDRGARLRSRVRRAHVEQIITISACDLRRLWSNFDQAGSGPPIVRRYDRLEARLGNTSNGWGASAVGRRGISRRVAGILVARFRRRAPGRGPHFQTASLASARHRRKFAGADASPSARQRVGQPA
jgi:enoyl-CoA hydratase